MITEARCYPGPLRPMAWVPQLSDANPVSSSSAAWRTSPVKPAPVVVLNGEPQVGRQALAVGEQAFHRRWVGRRVPAPPSR